MTTYRVIRRIVEEAEFIVDANTFTAAVEESEDGRDPDHSEILYDAVVSVSEVEG